MNFTERLRRAWDTSGSMLCVGLDPEPFRLPVGMRGRPESILDFTKAIVDATGDLVCAFKPQIAYFAAHRAEDQLEDLCTHIRATQPHVLLILDAKRGDIGPTAEQYAIEAFVRYGADAVTVNPYLGTDSITPFLEHRDRGIFVLCRTSNPGGEDLQDLDVGGSPLYERVAKLVAERWNDHRQCGLVVGGTRPELGSGCEANLAVPRPWRGCARRRCRSRRPLRRDRGRRRLGRQFVASDPLCLLGGGFRRCGEGRCRGHGGPAGRGPVT